MQVADGTWAGGGDSHGPGGGGLAGAHPRPPLSRTSSEGLGGEIADPRVTPSAFDAAGRPVGAEGAPALAQAGREAGVNAAPHTCSLRPARQHFESTGNPAALSPAAQRPGERVRLRGFQTPTRPSPAPRRSRPLTRARGWRALPRDPAAADASAAGSVLRPSGYTSTPK